MLELQKIIKVNIKLVLTALPDIIIASRILSLSLSLPLSRCSGLTQLHFIDFASVSRETGDYIHESGERVCCGDGGDRRQEIALGNGIAGVFCFHSARAPPATKRYRRQWIKWLHTAYVSRDTDIMSVPFIRAPVQNFAWLEMFSGSEIIISLKRRKKGVPTNNKRSSVTLSCVRKRNSKSFFIPLPLETSEREFLEYLRLFLN